MTIEFCILPLDGDKDLQSKSYSAKIQKERIARHKLR